MITIKLIISLNIFIFLNLFTGSLFAQTPYYSVKLNLTDTSPKEYIYVIKEHICQFNYKPVVPSGDYWFGKDTSTLNWNNLPDSMYTLLECRKSTATEGTKFEDGNQSMIWENIFSLTITRQKSNRKTDELVKYDTMIIVFPVLLKSFVTYINLGTVEFNPGYYELIDKFKYDTAEWLSLKIPPDMKWEAIDFENRKIKIDPRSFAK